MQGWSKEKLARESAQYVSVDDASYDITVQYEDIPRDLRMAIEADLTKQGKPKPTRKQIEDEYEYEYELFILDR
ncbi:MAG: hypothetical protein AAAB19_27070 [Rhizobium sp.]